MRCSRVQYLYEEYASGELPPVTAARIDEHLVACVACREFYESNDDISQILCKGSDIGHPGSAYLEGLTQRVVGSVLDAEGKLKSDAPEEPDRAAPSPLRAARPLWWAGAVAAAGLLALGLGTSPLWSPGGSRSGQLGDHEAVLAFPITLGGSPLADTSASPWRRENSPATMTLEDSLAPSGSNLLRLVTARLGEVDSSLEGRIGSGIAKSARRSIGLEAPAGGAGSPQGITSGGGLSFFLSRTLGLFGNEPVAGGTSRDRDGMAVTWLPETFEELLCLQTLGTEPALERLQARLQEIGLEPGPGRAEWVGRPIDSPLIDQVRHFRAAEAHQRARRFEDSAAAFRQVVEIDPTTPLALRASLRLGDLCYFEWGEFEKALNYYRVCDRSPCEVALNQDERGHVARQRRLLERFAPSGWAAVDSFRRLSRAPWPEAMEALERLAAETGGAELLPEAARTLVERVSPLEPEADATALRLVQMIHQGIAAQPEPEDRAWLYVSLGDLFWRRWRNAEAALEAYQRAVNEEGASRTAGLAQSKLRYLRDQVLAPRGAWW